MDEPEFPGAHPPERVSRVRSLGLELNVLEWGNPDADPLLLCHGMWDHARSFAALAPLLASRFRVLALDARGHGDSDWADAYNWEVEVLDVVHVLRWIGRPTFLVGHSMGGGQATDAACGVPHMVRKLVNIDGFGPPPFDESATSVQNRMAQYLERRRKSARRAWRLYASIDDLAERRQAQNPRLSTDWLRYFVYHGSRPADGGWVWKSDPHMGEGMGPWCPEWIGPRWAALKVPMLAVTGSVPDTWGPLPAFLLDKRLAHVARLERRTIEGAGHFVHIERPTETAAVILDHLGV